MKQRARDTRIGKMSTSLDSLIIIFPSAKLRAWNRYINFLFKDPLFVSQFAIHKRNKAPWLAVAVFSLCFVCFSDIFTFFTLLNFLFDHQQSSWSLSSSSVCVALLPLFSARLFYDQPDDDDDDSRRKRKREAQIGNQ